MRIRSFGTRAHELSPSGRSDRAQRRFSCGRSESYRCRRGGFRRGSGQLAPLSVAGVGTPSRKACGAYRCRERQAVGIPRWIVSVAAETRGRLHRDALGRQNHRTGSCGSHQGEHGTAISSVQDQRLGYSLSLPSQATLRARMLDDGDNAGAALPDCGRLRAVRPGASVQGVSPRDRYEPIGVAPRDASRDTASCRIISTLDDSLLPRM